MLWTERYGRGGRKKLLQSDAHFQCCQVTSRAHMLADAVDQVVVGVAIWLHSVGVTEDGLIPIRGRPVQLDARALWQVHTADRHRAGRDTAIGNEGVVDSKDLINDGIEFSGRNPVAEMIL